MLSTFLLSWNSLCVMTNDLLNFLFCRLLSNLNVFSTINRYFIDCSISIYLNYLYNLYIGSDCFSEYSQFFRFITFSVLYLDISIRRIKINVARRYNIFIGKGRDGIDFVFWSGRNGIGTGKKKLIGIGTSRAVLLRTLVTTDFQYYFVRIFFDSILRHKRCFILKFGL